jgi:hypothetical protein
MLSQFTKVFLFSLGMGTAAQALDISVPLVRCDMGHKMVLVGKKAASDDHLYISLYQAKKIQHPGYGRVNDPEAIIDTSPLTRVDLAITAVTYLSEGTIKLYMESQYADEDIDFEQPLSHEGRVTYMLDGHKQTIAGMKCKIFEESN